MCWNAVLGDLWAFKRPAQITKASVLIKQLKPLGLRAP